MAHPCMSEPVAAVCFSNAAYFMRCCTGPLSEVASTHTILHLGELSTLLEVFTLTFSLDGSPLNSLQDTELDAKSSYVTCTSHYCPSQVLVEPLILCQDASHDAVK